jgi:hypothetical protein
MPKPLVIFREGLALFRRAGLYFQHAYNPALDAALSAARNERERDEWLDAISSTRTAWMRAYERRDTGSTMDQVEPTH